MISCQSSAIRIRGQVDTLQASVCFQYADNYPSNQKLFLLNFKLRVINRALSFLSVHKYFWLMQLPLEWRLCQWTLASWALWECHWLAVITGSSYPFKRRDENFVSLLKSKWWHKHTQKEKVVKMNLGIIYPLQTNAKKHCSYNRNECLAPQVKHLNKKKRKEQIETT